MSGVQDYGEPWSYDDSDPDDVVLWDRTTESDTESPFVANCDEMCQAGVFDAGLERSKRIVVCVNALAGLDPDSSEVRAALDKLREGKP